jgi:predicted transcriptional regulator
MSDFIKLRQLARSVRDKKIEQAREECEATIAQIADLEKALCGTNRVRHPRANAAIEAAMPSDRPFTTEDIAKKLLALEPNREWSRHTINTHIARLRERGILKRISRPGAKQRATYARADLPIKADSRTLGEIIAVVVTRPMTLTEIAVAVKEAGYRTSQTGRHLRNHVARGLREGGYRQDGERWSRG